MTEFAPLKGRIFKCEELAKTLGWTTDRTRHWLKSTKLGFKRGGRWFTTVEKLISEAPDEWAELESSWDGDE